jgi:hypothetical protein
MVVSKRYLPPPVQSLNKSMSYNVEASDMRNKEV